MTARYLCGCVRTATVSKMSRQRHGMRWRVAWRTPVMPARAFHYCRTKKAARAFVERFLHEPAPHQQRPPQQRSKR